MTPLERARITYENACAAGTPTDPKEREESLQRFRAARAEYFRLLGEQPR